MFYNYHLLFNIDLLALKLNLSLPSSCYATMAIREILKIDTSAFSQTKLTKEISS